MTAGRVVGRALAGVAALGSAALVTGGLSPVLNWYNEQSIRGQLGAHIYAWTWMRERRLGMKVQPLRDELVLELRAMAQRLGLHSLEQLHVAVVPHRTGFFAASAGSFWFGEHQYLVIPESLVLNYTLSRVRVEDPFESTDAALAPFHPDAYYNTVLQPPDRYVLAHEMAHLACNHHIKRQGLQLLLGGLLVAVAPLLRFGLGLRVGVAGLAPVLGLPGAFFSLQAYARRQELEADQMAAAAGYGHGALQFWAEQLADPAVQAQNAAFEPMLAHPIPLHRFLALRAQMESTVASLDRG